jgi:hypothetical protein
LIYFHGIKIQYGGALKFNMAAKTVVKEVHKVNGIPSLISGIHAENFDKSKCKKAVVLIPGNPGIIRFYDSFLQSLFGECKEKLPIFGIQHAGILSLYLRLNVQNYKITLTLYQLST